MDKERIKSFYRALKARADLYSRLVEVASEQNALADSEIDSLFKLREEQNTLVESLDNLESVDDYAAQWEEVRDEMPDELRTMLFAEKERAREALETFIKLEQENSKKISRLRDERKNKMVHLSTGKQINKAYSRMPGKAESRFIDDKM
ncbi:MAG: hypothetical protein NUW37_17085 [Planctomycetes bacterium]|nr:hypothetical protein [Planctomycetota bacterium]